MKMEQNMGLSANCVWGAQVTQMHGALVTTVTVNEGTTESHYHTILWK